MELLTKQQLNTIRFDDFEIDVSRGARFQTLNGICLASALESDSIPYYSADDFRQGSCDLFALALQHKYRYEIYELQSGLACHYFCKAVVNGKTAYIDVRGITFDFRTFLHGLDALDVLVKWDSSALYDTAGIDLETIVSKVGFAFAEWIIQNAGDRYDVSSHQ